MGPIQCIGGIKVSCRENNQSSDKISQREQEQQQRVATVAIEKAVKKVQEAQFGNALNFLLQNLIEQLDNVSLNSTKWTVNINGQETDRTAWSDLVSLSTGTTGWM